MDQVEHLRFSLHNETEANSRNQEAKEQLESELSNMGAELQDLTLQHQKVIFS